MGDDLWCETHQSPQHFSWCEAGLSDYCEKAYEHGVGWEGYDLGDCRLVVKATADAELGGEG